MRAQQFVWHGPAKLGWAIGLLWVLSAAHAAVPPLPQVKPTVDSGKAPWGSTTRPGVNAMDLARHGYVEQEYYVSGKAAVRDVKGVVVIADAPYTTRILVFKPKQPKKFSGNVVVTPNNWDRESYREWAFTRAYIVEHGDAFVGISLVKEKIPGFFLANGLRMLKDFDPVRYAELGVNDELSEKRNDLPQGQDIMAQLAWLLKSNATSSPLGGLKVQYVFSFTVGILGPVMMGYIEQGRHGEFRMADGKPLYDGFMFSANSHLPVVTAAARSDVPYVVVQNERELHRDRALKLAIPADSDQPKFRLYDFVGAPHLGMVETSPGKFEKGNDTPEAPEAAPPSRTNAGPPGGAPGAGPPGGGNGAPPVGGSGGPPGGTPSPLCRAMNNEPVGLVFSALLSGMERWARGGAPMPHAAAVEMAPSGDSELIDAATGNAVGGLRPPWIEVPAATYYSGAAVGCGVYEPKVMYKADKLKMLYGSYEQYARRFDAAKAKFVKDGFLLPEQAVLMTPSARPADFVAP